MIKTQQELRASERQITQLRAKVSNLKKELQEKGLAESEIQALLLEDQRQIDFLDRQIDWYKNAKAGASIASCKFDELGEFLIATRISKGLSQLALARLLNVSPVQVSRDEQSEYKSLTLERAIRIFNALGISVSLKTDHDSAGVGAGEPPALRRTPQWKPAPPVVQKDVVEKIEPGSVASKGSSTPPWKPAFDREAVPAKEEIKEWTAVNPVPPKAVSEQVLQEKPVAKPVQETKLHKSNIKVKVSCKNKMIGKITDLNKALAAIEEEIGTTINGKKVSGKQGFLEHTAVYEFEHENKIEQEKIRKLQEQCEHLAASHKCAVEWS